MSLEPELVTCVALTPHIALPLDAARAFRGGLVNRLIRPGGALDAEPHAFGRLLAAEHFLALRQSENFKEDPRAFVEKRPPIWTER